MCWHTFEWRMSEKHDTYRKWNVLVESHRMRTRQVTRQLFVKKWNKIKLCDIQKKKLKMMMEMKKRHELRECVFGGGKRSERKMAEEYKTGKQTSEHESNQANERANSKNRKKDYTLDCVSVAAAVAVVIAKHFCAHECIFHIEEQPRQPWHNTVHKLTVESTTTHSHTRAQTHIDRHT